MPHDDVLERLFARADTLPRDRLIALGELSIFAGNQRNDAALTCMLLSMVSGVLMTWYAWQPVLAWMLVNIVSVWGTHTLAGRFLAVADRQDHPRPWEARLLGARLGTAVIWGALPLVAWPGGDVPGRFFLLLVLALHMALRVGAGPVRPAVLALQLLPPTLGLLALVATDLGDSRFAALLVGCVFYPLYLYRQGLRTGARLRRMMELQLDLSLAKLRADAASRAKASLLTFISHEVRTPMNGILGLTQVLLDSSLDDTQRAQVRTVRESGEALLLVLNDMLDLSKADAGCLEIHTTPFCPTTLLDGVGALMAGQAAAKGLSLRIETAGLPPCLVGDAFRLRQILLNLVGNALKFTQRGGVRVRAEVRDAPPDAPTPSMLRLVVSDTGVGIPEDARPLLFEPFTQVGGDMATRLGGSGMGLSIVRRLAQALGGEAGFESVVGQGSDFWVTLPVSPGSPDDLVATGIEPCAALPALNLLVVEDVPTNQMVLKATLNKRGHTVTIADSGKAALELLHHQRFDMALVDLHMPDMDGGAVARAIRALPDPALAATPLLAVTADTDMTLARLRLDGFDDLLHKPIRPEPLFATLARLWSRRSGATTPPPSAGHAGDGEAADGGATTLRDHAMLRSLVDVLGVAELPEFIARTIDVLDDCLHRLASGLEQGDLAQSRQALHTLRGVSANVGLTALADRAQDAYRLLMDATATHGHPQLPADTHQALADSVAGESAFLQEWLDGVLRADAAHTEAARA